MKKPPFDQVRPDHAAELAGEDEENLSEECDCNCHHCLQAPCGCIILAGAIIGTLLGTGAAIAGSHVAAWYFEVEVPWPW